MSESKTYVFGNDGANGNILGILAPLLSRQGIDPNMVYALMNNRNGNGFGEGTWFLWIIVLLALFRNGFGFGGNFGEQVGNQQGCSQLASYIATGNQQALSELSATLHCDVSALQTAINGVMASIQSVGSQVGMTSQQVINAIQLGNSGLASQLASCCCEIREGIAAFKGDMQLQLSQQTNALTNAINNVAVGQERGFSALGYETQRQTSDIEKAITAQTTFISDKFCQLEMREMQNKIDALRTENQNLKFAESQQAQNAYLINQLQPVARPSYIVASPYQSYYGYPYGYPYGNYGANTVNNGGYNCGCNY